MLKMAQSKSKLSPEDCYSSLRALNACKFEARELRELICKKMTNTPCTETQALVDGVVGLAGSNYKVSAFDTIYD